MLILSLLVVSVSDHILHACGICQRHRIRSSHPSGLFLPLKLTRLSVLTLDVIFGLLVVLSDIKPTCSDAIR